MESLARVARAALTLTGGTGYIGGSVLHTIATTHLEYEITVLLRTIPPSFIICYLNIKIVLGNFNNLIKEHARKMNIAIVCPPDVYGRGKGLGWTTSALVPVYVNEVRALGAAFYVAEGTNIRSWVYVDDLTRLYLRLVEAALIDLARETGRILYERGVINDAKPVQVGLEQLDAMVNFPEFPKLRRYMFASNSRTRAERAGQLFEYKAKAPRLMEVLESDILDAIKESKI
ncbi:hypothetical protein GQ44DRAFT_748063 [Phaeosphaeriaceae sp. PMI808]|nr:hypothetical protein GQ44DRAFT_748063 [Phaeosphaeriaceae sp. PMI808]